jgi:hypothetical protein
MPGSSKWSLSLRFPHHLVYTFPLPHMCYMPRSLKEPRPVCTEKVTNTTPDDPGNLTPLPQSLSPSTLANCQMLKNRTGTPTWHFTEHSVWDTSVHTTSQPKNSESWIF